MANDVRCSGVIEYLVGPDSHPELIRMSHNIGTFLVINHTFTPDIRDAIWQPLIQNKDARIVQAVMKMAMELMANMTSECLVDLCKKTTAIPFASYDTAMLDFVASLLNITTRKFSEECRVNDVDKRPVSMPSGEYIDHS